ncbi:MAG: 30S ribosomal protein S2 [Candidatus Bathyarchaeia archaeon]
MSAGEEQSPPAEASPSGAQESGQENLLLPLETLLSAGIQIGTRVKTSDMEQFVYKARPDGLFILDVAKINERIRIATNFLAQFDPKEVVVISSRLYGKTPVERFCELTGAMPLVGRFMPGMFTNPLLPNYLEPKVIVVTDPKADEQAVLEASSIGIPVVAICDSDNIFSKVDLVIPGNNKGRRSLAALFWLLARQMLRERKELAPDADPTLKIDDFETQTEEMEEAGQAPTQ